MKYFLIASFLLTVIWAHKDPNFADNRTTMVHLFEWTWKDIARECEEFLGPQGYGGVQISPPNEVREIWGQPWWARYQPVSYILVSKSGNEADLGDMIKRCNKVGVRIYADIVVNHMTGYSEGDAYGTAGSVSNYNRRSYPAVPYGSGDFNNACGISNYQDAAQVRNCQLSSLADLNQSKPYVRDMIVNYMNKLIDFGVAGFRIDAAKHMWPHDLEVIYGRLNTLNEYFGFARNSKPYIYQEVIDLGGESVKKTEYNYMGAVTEFKFSTEIGKLFRNKNSLRWLRNWGPEWSFLPSGDAIVFVDNHDNQRGHGAGGEDILTFKTADRYKLALAFMLAHPYGKVAQVMSSYSFSNSDQGPPQDGNGQIKSPSFLWNNQCDTANVGWVCEHRWPEVKQMVRFRNAVGNQPLQNWWSNAENQIAFSRGHLGFVAFNLEQHQDLRATLQTSLPQGAYCDVLSGAKEGNSCTGLKVEVGWDGKAFIHLGAGVKGLAIYSESKL